MPAENCLRGTIAGRETVIFDQRLHGGGFNRQYSADGADVSATVVGFRVPADSYCRDRGILQPSRWHVEKLGEWVFIFDGYRPLVKPAKIGAYIEEARAVFQSATDPNGYEPTILAGRLG